MVLKLIIAPVRRSKSQVRRTKTWSKKIMYLVNNYFDAPRPTMGHSRPPSSFHPMLISCTLSYLTRRSRAATWRDWCPKPVEHWDLSWEPTDQEVTRYPIVWRFPNLSGNSESIKNTWKPLQPIYFWLASIYFGCSVRFFVYGYLLQVMSRKTYFTKVFTSNMRENFIWWRQWMVAEIGNWKLCWTVQDTKHVT